MFEFFSEKTHGGKIHFILINLVRFSLLISFLIGIYELRWLIVFVSFIVFVLTYLPYIFEKKSKIDLPIEFEIFTVLLIYASLFLGELHEFYIRFIWWDALLHLGSAIALGFVGFTILYIMDKSTKVKANPSVLAFFAFCFAMALGSTWEIFEFAMDQIFGLNMQRSGLVDTMWDLIVDAVGALFASVSGYLYLKGKGNFIFNRIIRDFEEENKKLFKKPKKKARNKK